MAILRRRPGWLIDPRSAEPMISRTVIPSVPWNFISLQIREIFGEFVFD